MNTSGFRRRAGFTLIELLVVIAIIGILIALLVPAVQKVRESASRVHCQNNMKQLGLALHGYHDTHKGFPQGYAAFNPFGTPNNTTHKSWATLILPFIEQQNTAQLTYPANQATILALYGCPSDPRTGRLGTWMGMPGALTGYSGVDGALVRFSAGGPGNVGLPSDGVLYGGSRTRLTDIIDGTSNTVIVGERPPANSLTWGWWTWGPFDSALAVENTFGDPHTGNVCPLPQTYRDGKTTNECDSLHYWSLHPGGALWIFGDGSVRFLPYAAAPHLPALATRSGGEVIPGDLFQ